MKNFILGKKQIVLASLVVILGAAVYLNWQLANNSVDLDSADQVGAAVSETETNAPLTSSAPDETKQSNGTESINTDPASSEAAKETAAPAGETDSASSASQAGTEKKMLGDAKFVSSMSIADENYFSMAKLARTRSRDEAIETVSTILDNEKLTEGDKKEASAKAIAISDIIETESRIENLVKAKGFSECMAYLTDNSASVVVKSEGLTQEQATQIKNIVVAEGKIKGENISITEIK